VSASVVPVIGQYLLKTLLALFLQRLISKRRALRCLQRVGQVSGEIQSDRPGASAAGGLW